MTELQWPTVRTGEVMGSPSDQSEHLQTSIAEAARRKISMGRTGEGGRAIMKANTNGYLPILRLTTSIHIR